MEDVDLSEGYDVRLAEAIVTLSRASLCNVTLLDSQWDCLMVYIGGSWDKTGEVSPVVPEMRLEFLEIRLNDDDNLHYDDLMEIDPEILADALTSVAEVYIDDTKLTPGQYQVLANTIISSHDLKL